MVWEWLRRFSIWFSLPSDGVLHARPRSEVGWRAVVRGWLWSRLRVTEMRRGWRERWDRFVARAVGRLRAGQREYLFLLGREGWRKKVRSWHGDDPRP